MNVHGGSGKARRPMPVIVVLALLVVWLAAMRIHYRHHPIGVDHSFYATLAHEMLGGKALYSDLFGHKPPGTYISYAVAELLVGFGPQSVFLLNLLFPVATMLGLYFAVRWGTQNTTAGLWAAAVYVALTTSARLQATLPNTEVFMDAFTVWGVAALLHPSNGKAGVRLTIIAGGLLAVASLYKHVAVAVTGMLALGMIAACWRDRMARHEAFIQAGWLVGITVIAWAAVFAYFGVTGRLSAFWDAVIGVNLHYVVEDKAGGAVRSGGMIGNLLALCSFRMLFNSVTSLMVLPVMVGLAGVVVGFRSLGKPWLLTTALGVGSLAAVALPGRFYPHYYQLMIPPVCIAVGLAVASFESRDVSSRRCLAPWLGAAAIAFVLVMQYPAFRLSADELARIGFGERPEISRRMGREVNRLLADDETFYEWDLNGITHLYAKRPVPVGNQLGYRMRPGPFSERFIESNLNDLRSARPELVLLSKLEPFPERLHDWLSAEYVPYPYGHSREWHRLFMKRGGRLAREWFAGGDVRLQTQTLEVQPSRVRDGEWRDGAFRFQGRNSGVVIDLGEPAFVAGLELDLALERIAGEFAESDYPVPAVFEVYWRDSRYQGFTMGSERRSVCRRIVDGTRKRMRVWTWGMVDSILIRPGGEPGVFRLFGLTSLTPADASVLPGGKERSQ